MRTLDISENMIQMDYIGNSSEKLAKINNKLETIANTLSVTMESGNITKTKAYASIAKTLSDASSNVFSFDISENVTKIIDKVIVDYSVNVTTEAKTNNANYIYETNKVIEDISGDFDTLLEDITKRRQGAKEDIKKRDWKSTDSVVYAISNIKQFVEKIDVDISLGPIKKSEYGTKTVPDELTIITYSVSLNSNPYSSPYYIFTDKDGNNGTPTLEKGKTYRFKRTDSGHAFNIGDGWNQNTTGIKVFSKGSSSPVNGANSIVANETLTFKIPSNYTGTLKYFCYVHSNMIGDFTIQ